MSITKDGNNTLVETPGSSADLSGRSSTVRADAFAIRDRFDSLKQMQFDPSAQAAQTVVTFKSGASTSNITLTLPTMDTTLGSPIIPASTMYLFDDFISAVPNSTLGWGTAGSAGITAPSGILSQQHCGISVVHTSTSPTGAGIFYIDTMILLGGGVITAELLVRLSALSTVDQSYNCRIGFGNTFDGTDYTNGVYLEHTDSLNSGNWVFKSANNGTRTNSNTSVAPTTTDWQKVNFVIAAGGGSAEVFLDGVSAGVISTNIPTTSNRFVGPQMSILKSLGSTQRNLYMDYFYYTQAVTR